MPEIAELRAGDPTEVAQYRLTGRLATQVFLGRSRSGEPVVVRLLPPEMEPEPFLNAMEPLRGVSVVGAAQILAAGVAGEQAYLVTEFVDGPALKDVGGTVDGVGLYRLAAGTITALVALHQAGLVHGDIRPGNVLLGPDGPRVIDAGLEQAMAEASVSTRKVAVPAYTAPERLRGGDASPAADVFSWAATMVFAVTGVSPFEGGSMSATVANIAERGPDLPDLGELHDLIERCLDKDPAARPDANEVLLRLVGQTSFLTGKAVLAGKAGLTGKAVLTGEAESAPAPVPQTRPPRRARTVVSLVAAFAAGALLSGAGVYALTANRPPATTTAAASSAPATAATITSSPTEAPLEDVAEKADKDTKLPVVGVTLHEHSGDSMRLAAYLEDKDRYTSYARDRNGAFKAVSAFDQPVVSPGGDWVALNPMLKFQDSEVDRVKFTRMSTGESFVVSTVGKPLNTLNPVWSRDGGKLLLSVYDTKADPRLLVGFVVVDVAARKAAYVKTEYTNDSTLFHSFSPDGQIVRGYWDGKNRGLEFYDLSGQVTKTMHWVGLPRGGEWYSPSGTRIATVCPKGDAICVWDVRTGARQATVPFGSKEGSFRGWWNEKHLLIQDPGKKKGTAQIKIIDLVGTVKRVLADLERENIPLQFARVPAS
ncbi:serine/threonine protein kinase [Nonomuraea sp. PA05]|uniref:serine/threonine-protein kinase n=1 Tax=Nonomuraea sp. PA05 TaxID=2604466 RepID=UPI0011D4F732|nr:serine/threonine-protein kinase [Nonomuraea sp. PA05]TYB58659.1 serine/threonine protein kinase [Nonomuraea sp. PA05]